MSAQRDKRVYVLENYVGGMQVHMSVHSSHQKACSASPFPHKTDWVARGDVVFYHDASGSESDFELGVSSRYWKITKARIR